MLSALPFPTTSVLFSARHIAIEITAIDYAYHGLEAAKPALQCAFSGISPSSTERLNCVGAE